MAHDIVRRIVCNWSL